MVYEVKKEKGVDYLGGIDHLTAEEEEDTYRCRNWWSGAGNSTALRSVIMDDDVYSIAEDEIIAANVGALDEPIARISLTTD